MKSAEQWQSEIVSVGYLTPGHLVSWIRQIQRDALEHAATVVRDRGGDNEDYHAEAIVEELKRIP